MSEPPKLPTSPDEMPHDWDQHHNLRNTILGLGGYPYVSIHYEMDVRKSNALGESVGKWDVEIQVGRKCIKAEHEDIRNALWYVTTLASAVDDAEYERRKKAKSDALAKLTDEEKRLLGL